MKSIGKSATPQKWYRRLFKWFGRSLLLVIVLSLVGAVCERMAEASDAKMYLPPGKLVDVGGYRLHIHCTGVGSPTVVVEAGWGDFSSSWAWVQPEVAKSTRICTYDRAGMGWSEISTKPRTARVFATELHTLLTNAGESGPYVLVGHSLGAYTVRVYASDYKDEVAGVVFVDAQALSKMDVATITPAPAPGKTSFGTLFAHIGMVRLFADSLGATQELPDGDKQAYRALSVAPRSVQTFFDEGRGMSEGGQHAKAVTTLGALPLIVLSRGKEQDVDWATSQAGYLQLSSSGQQLYAEQSGHRIMIEQPEAAVASIVNIVEQVRSAPHK